MVGPAPLREAVALIPYERAEELSELLLERGALSATIEDAAAGGPGERPLFGEPGLAGGTVPWATARLTILYDPERLDLATALTELAGAPVPVEERELASRDWVRESQAAFGPIRIGPRLWIVPSWSEPVDPRAINIRLDPGVAFGTGAHPTTAMCLRWLTERPLRAARLLDYGCGTGILSVAAALLGAGETRGVDIDDDAVAAARDNAGRNRVTARFCRPEELDAGRFDVILANILRGPLLSLAPTLTGLLAPGGRLVLSGLLRAQGDEVRAAYAARGVALSLFEERDGWLCLEGKRD